jgi:hypothetical protein
VLWVKLRLWRNASIAVSDVRISLRIGYETSGFVGVSCVPPPVPCGVPCYANGDHVPNRTRSFRYILLLP